MRIKSAPLASAIAFLLLAGAVAAVRSSPGESPTEAALKARIAGLQADLARLRAERDAPCTEPAPGESGEEPPAAAREAGDPLPPGGTGAPPGSRSRAASRRGLRGLEAQPDPAARLALLAEALRTGDAGAKSRALSLLKTLGGPGAAALAAGVLQEEGPPWLRAQAASVLADLGDPAALPFLIDASQADDLEVRAGSAAALARFGQAAPLRDLIVMLAGRLDHPDGRMREDAVAVLSTLRSSEAVPTLAKALGDPTNSRIREAAADALGQSRLAEAIPSLESALDDAEPEVRAAARRALDALQRPAPVPRVPRS